MSRRLFTSESVTEGHPDKVSDLIADTILDAHLALDPKSRVACEVLCKGDHVHVAGEITSEARIDVPSLVRNTVADLGYTDPDVAFCASRLRVTEDVSVQSPEIARGVQGNAQRETEIGAGDQGLMFGYATDETTALMPLPLHLAHRLARGLTQARRSGEVSWLRPDGKTQVTVRREEGQPPRVERVVVSSQHDTHVSLDELRAWVATTLVPRELGEWHHAEIDLLVNPAGSFVQGGPVADCGVTGRKIIVDTYGGEAAHGGGAFSGKDATKVDRSAAYFCRYVARQIVKRGLAKRVQLQVAYAIGHAQPVSLQADTFGTGDEDRVEAFAKGFDFRPGAIVQQLALRQPIYRHTTNYGHFGRPGFTWEA